MVSGKKRNTEQKRSSDSPSTRGVPHFHPGAEVDGGGGVFLLFCLRDESFCYLSEEEIDLNIRSRLECTTHSLPRVSTRGRLTNKRGLANDEEFQKAYSVDMADVTQEIE